MKLDFENHIRVEHGYFLFPLPDEKYKALPEVYDKTCAVTYMASKIESEPDKHKVPCKPIVEAYIRAALSELIALEEFILDEYHDIDQLLFKIYKTTDPILHMIKLLRNYNIHVSSSMVSQKSMRVRSLNEKIPEFDIEVAYISNLNFEAIRNLRSSKDYTDDQLRRMLDIFEEQQNVFGISTLLIKVALSYIGKFERYIKSIPENGL